MTPSLDIQAARQNAIDCQIRPWGGLDYLVNNALYDTPREQFVPAAYQGLAFADMEIPLSKTARMLSPKMEGRLLSALHIQKDETVLEIGTGSGYLTAVLSLMCATVTSVEIDENLSAQAQKRLDALGISNVKLHTGDASKTWSSDNFFEVVVVSASVPKITGRYFHLLNIGGRIFVVEGTGSAMKAKLITRLSEHKWDTQVLFETQLAPLQGLETPLKFEF